MSAVTLRNGGCPRIKREIYEKRAVVLKITSEKWRRKLPNYKKFSLNLLKPDTNSYLDREIENSCIEEQLYSCF